jgi:acyl carrier protein
VEFSDVQDRVEGFVRSKFSVSEDDPHFDRTIDLFESGYVDSVGVVELLAFLNEEFGVEVPENLLLSEDFTNVNGIARIVEQLR